MSHPSILKRVKVPKYGPLDVNDVQFRLLRLQKLKEGSDSNTKVYCKLEYHSLIDPPPYDALSYEWGDFTTRRSIIVNNREVHVRANLEAALKQLRAKGHTTIWVDALCINQDDLQERSLQVLRMGDIYARARQVIAWLGYSTPSSNLVFHLCSTYWLAQDIPTEEEISLAEKFMERSYWGRVWIIQEISKASEVLIMCGESSISLDKLSRILQMFGCEEGNALPPFIQRFASLKSFREREQSENRKGRMRLLDAMIESRRSLSTDPRDKVYALLGLSSDGSEIVSMPNYRQSVEVVFSNITRTMLKRADHLASILLARYTTRSYPSWLPNWGSLDGDLPEWILSSIRQKFETQISPKVTGNTLEVSGTIVDTIDGLTSCMSQDFSTFSSLNDSKYGVIQGRAVSKRKESYKILSSIYIAICGRSALSSEYDRKELAKAFVRAYDSATNDSPDPSDPSARPKSNSTHAFKDWLEANETFLFSGSTIRQWVRQFKRFNIQTLFIISAKKFADKDDPAKSSRSSLISQDNSPRLQPSEYFQPPTPSQPPWPSTPPPMTPIKERAPAAEKLLLASLARAERAKMRLVVVSDGKGMGMAYREAQPGDKIAAIDGCGKVFLVLRPRTPQAAGGAGGYTVVGEMREDWRKSQASACDGGGGKGKADGEMSKLVGWISTIASVQDIECIQASVGMNSTLFNK